MITVGFLMGSYLVAMVTVNLSSVFGIMLSLIGAVYVSTLLMRRHRRCTALHCTHPVRSPHACAPCPSPVRVLAVPRCSTTIAYIIPCSVYVKLYPEPHWKKSLAMVIGTIGAILMPLCIVATFL